MSGSPGIGACQGSALGGPRQGRKVKHRDSAGTESFGGQFVGFGTVFRAHVLQRIVEPGVGQTLGGGEDMPGGGISSRLVFFRFVECSRMSTLGMFAGSRVCGAVLTQHSSITLIMSGSELPFGSFDDFEIA